MGGVHHRVDRADARGQLPLDPVVAAADPSCLESWDTSASSAAQLLHVVS